MRKRLTLVKSHSTKSIPTNKRLPCKVPCNRAGRGLSDALSHDRRGHANGWTGDRPALVGVARRVRLGRFDQRGGLALRQAARLDDARDLHGELGLDQQLLRVGQAEIGEQFGLPSVIAISVVISPKG